MIYNIDPESLLTTGGIVAIGIIIFNIVLIIRIFYMTANVYDINNKISKLQEKQEEQHQVNVELNRKIIELLHKISEQNKKE